MDLENIIAQEYQLRADLREAEETYKSESLKLRCKIGAEIQKERESAGLNVAQTARLLGCVRQRLFASENPDKVPNPFSVSALLTTLQTVEQLTAALATVPKITKK
jgi:predicted XRE-type DNA-binding protein